MPTSENQTKAQWIVSATSIFFVLLQSACTAVMAISGVRLVIGLGALAAASGLGRPAVGFHQDVIRIPMMVIAVLGSAINLYVIRRIRSLRSRPAAQWRVTPPTTRQIRLERLQIVLAVVTLLLVVAEGIAHRFVYNG